MPKGIRGFQKGYKPTEETKRKQIEKLMGNQRTLGKHWKLSEEVKQKHSKRMMGNTHSKGQIPWNKGLKGFMAGEKSPRWLGDNSKEKIREKERLIIAGRVKPKNCEICKKDGRIVFDHDHNTGEFRGWICYKCNLALGCVDDNVKTLETMIGYLTKITSNNPIIDNKKYLLISIK